MSNGKISAGNGVANVDPSIYNWTLMGATCPTTLRVGVTVQQSFKFLPPKGDGVDLVLLKSQYKTLPNDYCLFHIRRKADGYLRVMENPKDVADLVGADHNYQVLNNGTIELVVGQVRFTSDTSAQAAEGETLMIANVADILKFIAGHIKLSNLRAAAKRAQRELSLKRQLQDAKVDLQHERNHVNIVNRENTGLKSELASVRSQLAALAESE